MSKITSKEALLFEYKRLNPKLAEDTIVLTKEGFKKLVYQTWKHAASQGFDKGVSFAKAAEKTKDPWAAWIGKGRF